MLKRPSRGSGPSPAEKMLKLDLIAGATHQARDDFSHSGRRKLPHPWRPIRRSCRGPLLVVAGIGGRGFIRIALAGSVSGIARGELPRREIGIGWNNALLELVDFEPRDLLGWLAVLHSCLLLPLDDSD